MKIKDPTSRKYRGRGNDNTAARRTRRNRMRLLYRRMGFNRQPTQFGDTPLELSRCNLINWRTFCASFQR